MKILMTGANGTVGKALSNYLKARNIEVIAWNRQEVPIDNYQVMEDYIKSLLPDMIFHLASASKLTGRDNESWLVNYSWGSELAWISQLLGIRFIFTSSVMVFTDNAKGPFTLDSVPDAKEGYGGEKYRAEQRVLAQNPDALVARLGWQIGEDEGGNQMLDYLIRQMAQHGEIRASTKWYPACSLIQNTVPTLFQLALSKQSGVFQIDQNKRWTFYEIVKALNEKHGTHWHIVPTDDFVYDQRMIDERVRIPPLNEGLSGLP